MDVCVPFYAEGLEDSASDPLPAVMSSDRIVFGVWIGVQLLRQKGGGRLETTLEEDNNEEFKL
jgi:hypothetical protein